MKKTSLFKRLISLLLTLLTLSTLCAMLPNLRITAVAADRPLPDATKESMETLVKNIITRYEKSDYSGLDDWELMNIGFYRNVKRESAADLPGRGFSLKNKLLATNAKSMTGIARAAMMLTAMGIDISQLDNYSGGGAAFKLSSGEEVHSLAEALYNYNGSYTINGPVFTLIALDMGNYSIPDDAIWTREKLLDELLDHTYGSDGFDVDMVGMLMQAIGPYREHPVYGDRVKAKLDEGVEFISGVRSAPMISPMKEDYTFSCVMASGVSNSESAAQVICGLTGMGIDTYSDERFSGDDGSVLESFLSFVTDDNAYFKHTLDGTANAMATYMGCYTLQWYLNFLENGGAGNPYSLYYQRFDFSESFSESADILSFTLEGKTGVIDQDANTIAVTLPKGTSLTEMTPVYTLSEGATLISPALPVRFVEGVAQPFTVQAADGATRKTYQVTVQLDTDILASGAYIYTDTIQFQDQNQRDLDSITGPIITTEAGVTYLEFAAPSGTDVTALLVSADLAYGASSSPALDGTAELDLSDWREVTVTSGDGANERTYRIRVAVDTYAAIEGFSFTINGTTYPGSINQTTKVITVKNIPSTADITALTPEITLGTGTTGCTPSQYIPQDFSDDQVYTVTGSGLLSSSYTVIVTKAGATGSDTTETGVEITSFTVLGVAGTINHTAGTITVTLSDSNDVSQVAPVVTVPDGCTVSPVSGQIVNLNSAVVYTVTNGTESKSYTVSVTLTHSAAAQMWDSLADEVNIKEHQISRGRSTLSDID